MSEKQWVSDLESLNIDGSNRLRQLLTTCTDPIATIISFQERNSVKLQTLKSAMRLLDLHNVRRTEFHELAVNDVSELLLAKIKALGAADNREAIIKLEQQLEKCFKLYRVPSIRPIVLETLKQLPKVPDRYLKVIAADKDFYEYCAVTVRQQIWLKNDTLFMNALLPVLDSYIEDKRKVIQTVDQMATNFFTCETTKSRRQWSQIKELMSMIGIHEPLYRRVTNVVRDRFIKTADNLCCSLRMEILMAAHDLNLDSVVRSDQCHDFAWCLDACVRDKHLDAQQTNKLKNILDSTRKMPAEIIGDLAMIAGDAHVVHFLSSMCIKVLRDNVVQATGHLPRELAPLQLLLRLLNFGASAHQILSTKDSSGSQNVDALTFTKFLSSFTSMIAEDVIRFELNRAPDEIVDENPLSDYLSEPSEVILSFLKTDVSCALLWIHYLLDLLPSKRRAADLAGVMRYLKALPRLKDKIAYSDPWLHLITHRLVQSTTFDNLLSIEQSSNYIIDEYLMKGLDLNSGVKYQLLRIVNLLWQSIGDFRSRLIFEKIAPDKVFEPGITDIEDDVQRYCAEYRRIYNKRAEKKATTDAQQTATPSLTPVDEIVEGGKSG